MLAESPKAPAVFLDRDGVLVIPEIRDGRSYAPRRLDSYEFYPGAAGQLAKLKAAGFLLVVVTNQPDIGNGLVSVKTMEQMHRRLADSLPVDDIRLCPHISADGCACRKPRPGMLMNAAAELNIDLARSFMVGDRAGDVAAGKAAGCRTVFIDLCYEAERPPDDPDWTVSGLGEAVECILTAARQTTA